MAYRRRQGMARSSTFKEEVYHARMSPEAEIAASYSSPSSLAAQALRASAAAHRDSSHAASREYISKGVSAYDSSSMDGVNGEGSFWGVIARKAKAILEEENVPQSQPELIHSKKLDNPTFRKGIDALTVSMNRIGDTIGNAFEEGRTIVENRTADFIHETRKLQMKRKEEQNSITGQTSQEDMLKASRDVAMATAAKAKLLLRELKTVKADLAFAKQRCSQLEEENKILREAREKGVNPEDDDMIRLQLETLLAEKARLANENSVFARENRFLREIVEYHQLTMQDVVYLDEGIEEVTEVYPMPALSRTLSASLSSPPSRSHSCASLAEEMLQAEEDAVKKERSSSGNGDATTRF